MGEAVKYIELQLCSTSLSHSWVGMVGVFGVVVIIGMVGVVGFAWDGLGGNGCRRGRVEWVKFINSGISRTLVTNKNRNNNYMNLLLTGFTNVSQ